LVPDGVTDEEAVFAEPLAAALEVLEQVHVRPTESVAVVGDGKLGLLVAQVLSLTGCHLIVLGRHPAKLEILRALGITVTTEPPVEQYDMVVECTGQATGFDLARRLTRPRGTLVLKSTFAGPQEVLLTSLVVDEITLIGSRCGPFAPALKLLARGLVLTGPLLSAVFPLEHGIQAMEKARERGTLKVLLRP
jgi:alcohol dehydrogenase